VVSELCCIVNSACYTLVIVQNMLATRTHKVCDIMYAARSIELLMMSLQRSVQA
jgi:hypothetical protein